MADIPATVAAIAARLDIYAAYLPKAARWQAELTAEERDLLPRVIDSDRLERDA